MPRRALRCMVDLQLHMCSAPGVWLPSKEDTYISVSLFNQYRNTRLLTSIFPLIIDEKFRFEKTYYTAVDPTHVADMLDDELIIFELVQLSEYTDGAVRLASYSTNARDFLYPYSSLCHPSYTQYEREREALMCRTIAFPGISPKLEFSTKTVIKESVSAELDALDDALYMEREYRKARRSRTRRSSPDADRLSHQFNTHARECWTEDDSVKEECNPHYSMPTVSSICRSRSPSPTMRRKLADINLSSTIDPRPPFVVRKLEEGLIGRKPGTADRLARSKKKRSASPYRLTSVDDFNISYNATPRYRHSSSYLSSPTVPLYKTHYSTLDTDIDKEVAELTSIKTTPRLVTPRPRSVSPLLYRSSFKSRYGDISTITRPYSPIYYDRLIAREEELARIRRYNRLYGTYSSLDDLEVDLRLARIRAGLY